MTELGDIRVTLAAISFVVSWLLAVAWADFGRPRHALTWSIAFGLFGLSWLLALLPRGNEAADEVAFLLLALATVGTGLNSLAFYQRSGNDGAWRSIAIVIGVQLTAIAVVLWWTRSLTVAVLPYILLNAIAAWHASRALHGRRKGERAAERAALYWLRGLALFCFGLFLYTGANILQGDDSALLFRLIHVAPILPAILTGIGLFAIFLLTADLADQSRRLAGTDMLTGLLNRRGFDEAASALLRSVHRQNRRLCLAMIDIDFFKEINDRFGHLAGDEVLRRFGACLAAKAGPRDIVARVGGEEFALMFPDRDRESAVTLLEATRRAIAACALNLPADRRITASFGGVFLNSAYDLPALLSAADRALYAAKDGGRNRVVIGD